MSAIEEERAPSRRTVLTASAWSIPVLAAAAAAPAQAGSPAVVSISGSITPSISTQVANPCNRRVSIVGPSNGGIGGFQLTPTTSSDTITGVSITVYIAPPQPGLMWSTGTSTGDNAGWSTPTAIPGTITIDGQETTGFVTTYLGGGAAVAGQPSTDVPAPLNWRSGIFEACDITVWTARSAVVNGTAVASPPANSRATRRAAVSAPDADGWITTSYRA